MWLFSFFSNKCVTGKLTLTILYQIIFQLFLLDTFILYLHISLITSRLWFLCQLLGSGCEIKKNSVFIRSQTVWCFVFRKRVERVWNYFNQILWSIIPVLGLILLPGTLVCMSLHGHRKTLRLQLPVLVWVVL